MQNIDLKKYVCTVPFTTLEVHKNDYYLCCPSWLTKQFKAEDYTIDTIWNSDAAIEVRESILDGSYRFCDKTMCPFLGKLVNEGIVTTPIFKKESSKYKNARMETNSPTNVLMNFDRTCNYKCPSCRVDLIVENGKGITRVEKTIEDIDKYYSNNVKTLYITGSGDPFVSVGFRNYLRTFNPLKYPKLQTIHLHTNASMWTKEMWDSMPNIHPYVKTCEISIDAGAKDTYENKTRLGGNWDTLINNLKFINTIKTLTEVKVSFVVQDCNYMEMVIFCDLMDSIFKNKVKIFFGKINNWGTFNEGEFKLKKVWDTEHPEHSLFLTEFDKIWRRQNIFHNMYEFITINKTLI